MAAAIDVQNLWKQVNDALRRGPINRALWDAAAAAVPLVIEDDVVILGFEPRDMRHASYLETTVNKTRIQEIMQARTGKRLDMKCIEGATLQAWESVKQREADHEAKLRAGYQQLREHGSSVGAWEELSLRLTRMFGATEARRLPSVQASMVVRSLPLVYEVDAQVRLADPGAESIHNRELNRMFDKIGTFCDLPATQVALEYMRYQGTRKAKQAPTGNSQNKS